MDLICFPWRKSKAAGAPLDIIVPSEGVGWDMEATAIVAGTSKLEALKLVDFQSPKKPMKCTMKLCSCCISGVAKLVEHFPEGLIEAMIPNDFEFAANNRAHILKEWQSRYDGKSDPNIDRAAIVCCLVFILLKIWVQKILQT